MFSARSVKLFQCPIPSPETDSLIQALLSGVRLVVQNGLTGGEIVVGLKRRNLILQVIGYAEWITRAQVRSRNIKIHVRGMSFSFLIKVVSDGSIS